MRLRVLACLACVWSGLAAPLAAKDCVLSNNYCVPFVACTQSGDDLFWGYTLGRRSGPVYAVSTDGIECKGNWKRTAIGAGRTLFLCTDGRSGRGTFTYFDSTTGTAKGSGRTSGGDRLVFLAGSDIDKFIASGKLKDRDPLACLERALEQIE